MLYYKRMFVTSLLNILVVSNLWATFVHVSDVEGRDLARAVTYNVNDMRFTDITYFEKSTAEDSWVVSKLPKQYKLFSSGQLTIDQSHSKHYFLTTIAKMYLGKSAKPLDPNYFLPKESTSTKDILKIMETAAPAYGDELPIMVMNHDRSNNSTLKEFFGLKSKIEQGILGELATDMIMLSHGYTKFDSHNACNHGLDGVFISSDYKTIFLTESKFRKTPESAERILRNVLDGHHLLDRKIGKAPEDVQAKIKSFFDCTEAERQIILLAHRTLLDGTSEVAHKEVDRGNYHLSQLVAVTPSISREDHDPEASRELVHASIRHHLSPARAEAGRAAIFATPQSARTISRFPALSPDRRSMMEDVAALSPEGKQKLREFMKSLKSRKAMDSMKENIPAFPKFLEEESDHQGKAKRQRKDPLDVRRLSLDLDHFNFQAPMSDHID